MTPSTIEAMAREAASDTGADFHCDLKWLARFAALVRAQCEAEQNERLGIIADELIAGLGQHGRELAEMIRQGVTALESHAAYFVQDVRARALEDAAREADRFLTSGRSPLGRSVAAAIRALPPSE